MADAHTALEQWAKWVRDALSGVGWPERTLLARLIEYGAIGCAQQQGGRLLICGSILPHDELCEWVEAAIMRLSLDERNVIVRVYLHWETDEVSARELGINVGCLRVRLSRARRSVRDYLDGRKAAAVA